MFRSNDLPRCHACGGKLDKNHICKSHKRFFRRVFGPQISRLDPPSFKSFMRHMLREETREIGTRQIRRNARQINAEMQRRQALPIWHFKHWFW